MKLHQNQLNLILHLIRLNIMTYEDCLKFLDTENTGDMIAMSYVFRPLTKNGYNAKIHLPKPGINFIGYISKKNTQGFIHPLHAAAYEADIFDVIMDTAQFFFASVGQGQVGTAAVEVLFVGLGLAVAN